MWDVPTKVFSTFPYKKSTLMNFRGKFLIKVHQKLPYRRGIIVFKNTTKQERRAAKKTNLVDSIYETVVQVQKDTTITVTVDKTNGVITVDNPTQINVNVVVK